MDRQAELVELLRQVVREQPEIMQGGVHIHIHGPIILGADISSVAALKLLLRAYSATQGDPPALTKVKLVP